MTIEERDTARAIQTIAREFAKKNQPKEIDWEQRRYDLIRDIYMQHLNVDYLDNEAEMKWVLVKSEKAANILINYLKAK